MDSITGLSPDLTQLAAALESVKFEKDEVLGAIREAWTDGNAPVGWTPEWGDSKFRVYPVLSMKSGRTELVVFASIEDFEVGDPNQAVVYTIALHATSGEKFLSSTEQDAFQVIDLPDPNLLIGAHLELAK